MAGDLVFSYETRLGEAALIPTDLRCCLGRRMALARPDRNLVDPKFLLYYFLSPTFQTLIKNRTVHGSTVDRIALTEFPSFTIRLPDLRHQRIIARVLRALDDKIDLNQRMNRTLESMAKALYGDWVAKNEGQETTLKVQDLIDRRVLVIGDGYRAKRVELGEEGLPFARAGNLTDGFDFVGAELLGPEGIRAAREKVARDYDAAFTSKGTVGRLAQVLPNTPRFVYAPQLCYWRVLDRSVIDPHVLFQWMKGREFSEQIDAMKGQTDMADYVSLGDQRRIGISLPFSADQTELGIRLDGMARRLDANLAENRSLASLRDCLLPKLLSGELQVGRAEKVIETAL